MAKPVLFVDIDGVMADSHSWWLELYNYNHGTVHKITDITEWDSRVCIGADLSPYFGNYDMVDPVPDSFGCVDRLSMKYRIVFATAGQGTQWLKKYIAKPEVIVAEDKSLLRGFALIDDRPLNLDTFVGFKYLLSRPWNQGRGLNDASWMDIADHLMSLEI